MKLSIRSGLVAAAAVAAVAVAVPPAGAADAKTGLLPPMVCKVRSAPANAVTEHAMDARVLANPKRIKAAAYNQARSILARAGSDTAAKSHPVHGTGDVPVEYGTTLLACSRDEFRQTDRNAPDKRAGMTPFHYLAIHDAARTMGITHW